MSSQKLQSLVLNALEDVKRHPVYAKMRFLQAPVVDGDCPDTFRPLARSTGGAPTVDEPSTYRTVVYFLPDERVTRDSGESAHVLPQEAYCFQDGKCEEVTTGAYLTPTDLDRPHHMRQVIAEGIGLDPELLPAPAPEAGPTLTLQLTMSSLKPYWENTAKETISVRVQRAGAPGDGELIVMCAPAPGERSAAGECGWIAFNTVHTRVRHVRPGERVQITFYRGLGSEPDAEVLYEDTLTVEEDTAIALTYDADKARATVTEGTLITSRITLYGDVPKGHSYEASYSIQDAEDPFTSVVLCGGTTDVQCEGGRTYSATVMMGEEQFLSRYDVYFRVLPGRQEPVFDGLGIGEDRTVSVWYDYSTGKSGEGDGR